MQDDYNRVLKHLSDKRQVNYLLAKNVYEDLDLPAAQQILDKLIEHGFCHKTPAIYDGVRSNEFFYMITQKGIQFYEDPPTKYINNVYQFIIDKENKKLKDAAKESWPKRNWFWVALIGYAFGVSNGLILEYYKRKIPPIPSQLDKTIPILSDSLSHIPR